MGRSAHSAVENDDCRHEGGVDGSVKLHALQEEKKVELQRRFYHVTMKHLELLAFP